MTICVKCGRRKAKRACPTLGSPICALCCGTLREKEIRCVPSCRHLREHRPYQAKRALEKTASPPKAAERKDPRRDERLAWLAIHVEAALLDLARRNPAFNDREAVLALDEARDGTVKPPALLIVPGQAERRTKAAAAAIVNVLDTVRFESGRILTSESGAAYRTDEKLAVLDAVLAEARRTADRDLEGRAFLSALTAKLERLKAAAARGPKIV